MAQALVDIHDGLLTAELAVHRQAGGSGIGVQPKDFASPAFGTEQPAVLYC